MAQFELIGGNPEDIETETGIEPDLNNPLYDLFIKDEKLGAAADKAFESMQHMASQLKKLDETDPAYEPLCEVMGNRLTELAETSDQDYRRALEEIDAINSTTPMDRLNWLIAAGGTAFATMGAAQMGAISSPGAGAAIAAGGMAASTAAIGSMQVNNDVQEANRVIEEYLEFAGRVEQARNEFDATWSRLIEDEQPEEQSQD